MFGNLCRQFGLAATTLLIALVSTPALSQVGANFDAQLDGNSSSSIAPPGKPFLMAQSAQGVNAATSGLDQSNSTLPAEQDLGPKLEEIIVTATRVSASIEKVPLSINAISQDELMTRGIESIADIAAVTPGLQFTTPNPYMSTISEISIRGLNTVTGASVVGIYLDDTPVMSRISPVGNVGSPYPIVFDLNRVEVARGPQGTLFGAGSEAGTVRFITNEPSLSRFSGFVHSEVGFTQNGDPSAELGAAAGGPIIDDKLGFRVSVWDRHDGGYVDRIDQVTGATVDRNTNTDDKFAIRGALAYQATDDIRITPSVTYQSVRTGDNGRIWANFSDRAMGTLNGGAWLPDASTDSYVLPTAKVEAHLPFAELTFTTSYFDRRVKVTNDQSAFLSAFGVVDYGSPLGPGFSTSPADAAPTVTGLRTRALTEEVRLASNEPGAFLTWVAGIFNDHRSQRDYLNFNSIAADPGVSIGYFDQNIYDQQTALFAQGDFHITKKWTATLGARVAHVETYQTNFNGNGVFNAGTPPYVNTGKLTQNPTTPKIAVSYQATPNNLFYISAGKGFRVGGGNEPVPTICGTTVPNGYGSDYVWSYELGSKNTLWGGKLQIDSSVYHIDWSKIQQVVQLTCGQQYTANTGSAVSNGFDLSLRALVTARLKVELDVGYVNAYFTQNVFDQAGQPLVLAGDKIGLLPQVNPPWDADASATYDLPLREDHIKFRAEFQFHSRNPGPFITQIPASPSYFPLDVPDPPTHLVNARVDYTKAAVDIGLFVNNALNSHPQIGASQFSGISNLITYSTFRPRTLGMSVNWKF